MRVGLLTTCYLPLWNGVTVFTRLHQKELERRGVEAWVFTMSHREVSGIEHRTVRVPGHALGNSGYFIRFLPSLQAHRRLASMDILHFQHPIFHSVMYLARRRGIPIILTSHTRYDLYGPIYGPPLSLPVWERILRLYFPLYTRFCDAVTVPSATAAEVMRRWGVLSRLEVIHNGIQTEPFQAPPKRNFREEWGIPRDAVVAIFVGRLGGEKRVLPLVRVFRQALADGHPKAYLVLVGGGPQRPLLEERIRLWNLESQVRLVGPYPHEAIPDCLKAADLFVSASTSEVHPITFLEAAAAGLPLLGRDSPGVKEIVQPGENGFLAQDDVQLSAYWTRLLSDAALRHRLALGARRSSQRYSIHRTTSEFLRLYEDLLNRR